MTRKYAIALIIIILVFTSILVTSIILRSKPKMATLLDGHSKSNYNGYVISLMRLHPSTTGKYSSVGQAFKVKTTGAKYKLTQFKVYLQRHGSLTGHLKAVLYNMTGTYGTDAKPTGSPLAISDLLDVVEIPLGSSVEITFNFVGSQQYEVLKDHAYCICIQANDGNWSDANYVSAKMRHVVGGCETHDGNLFHYTTLGWRGSASDDLCFLVYGTLVSPPPPEDKVLTMEPPSGEGSVVPSVGEHEYAYGTWVYATATPAEGWEFQKWLFKGYPTSQNPLGIYMNGSWGVKAVFAELPARGGEWVNPTGGYGWTVPQNAYNNDLGNYAVRPNPGAGNWTPFLVLTHAPLWADMLRFYAWKYTQQDLIDIDVYKVATAEWIHVYEGSYSSKVYIEKSFDLCQVDKMRIRVHFILSSGEARIYDTDFWSITVPPPPIMAKKLGSDLAVLLSGSDKGKLVILV